ncbi:beta-ketoacyl-ACP reductase [Sinomonas cyclohexanicum]|uniref:Beta-ketoacyl-ACP reductase n=1 Tax=Sinomonas cyclohexanicum TaxID=322009 RepID=A0ABM7PSM9_SINCY|nr:SDR family NAD(P)-dependent oxidoreductase [Corynebacterium cyclohexanicum]BCT75237.1 beta-ketoacyl-ACP reductase [Corynebacterium cyclohexanicum]
MSTEQNTLKSAIVTGGAGGIGSAVCRRLADLGYAVVVADANAEAAQATAASLPGEMHAAVGGDLTATSANREAVEAAVRLGPIGLLVNAVGISPKEGGRKKPFYDVTDEEWDLVMAVNVKAPFILVREAFRHMSTDGTASIINLLSITSRMATGGLPDATFGPFLPSSITYAASKAALQNMTASLARELAGLNIRVNGVAPGFVETPMTGGMPDMDRMIAQIPAGRFAKPHEITDAIEFLVSDRASYINGTSLEVNGGWQTC